MKNKVGSFITTCTVVNLIVLIAVYSNNAFWSNLIIQIIGALIGAIVAVLIFIKQIDTNRVTDEEKKAEIEDDKLFYLAASLENVSELINVQIKSMEVSS